MHILIVNNTRIPVQLYGGTERVIWSLGQELVGMGHRVTYLVGAGSSCPFARVLEIDPSRELIAQIPADVDVVHFHFAPERLAECPHPYVLTVHGNTQDTKPFDQNAIFVSEQHAARHGSASFVHNGLNWDDYTAPDWSAARTYFHFLGNAAWRVKNVRGAIDVIKSTKAERLKVLGGVRFNFNQGIRFTFSTRVQFCGMVGGEKKDRLMMHSKGLIFPVRWHEPFGLALIESLYYGCPVFGTPYGSLPEIVYESVGFLSASKSALAEAVENAAVFSQKTCHEYARDRFNSRLMARAYLDKYETVLSQRVLNEQAPCLQEKSIAKFLPWVD